MQQADLFYQVRGDMCLKVIENGKHKDVTIREGEMFLLPARIPHSPQRQANTVGLVVERLRLPSETDCLRYYVENSMDVLFERWFHCLDLGTQLVPVIKEFFSSEQHRTGKPSKDEPLRTPPFQLNGMHVMKPFVFSDWVTKHRPALAEGRPLSVFGPQFETEIALYGPGVTDKSRHDSDIWIWQLEGSSQVTMDAQTFSLCAGDSVLIPQHSQYQWARNEDCIALYVVQNPERKSAYF
ncbi:3-hydroxyanthranilate 3,4-dioxygenase isoform X2 [Conger conger]|uniref:3-hydroxyanthranilate 3,4-dioxygenase isoform X2 n=1 Tax=Conger conger TaxID=82655 RepID=UPI002A598C9C|nr:3-hydroxyanthranilate 3,4-dioxygenase isoform X2 [Conger conger]